jgi:transcriptional regulator
MYMPKHFEEPDVSVLHALIRSHPLGAWVTQSQGELLVNHIPFLVDPSRGEHGTLVGHVARANPVWKSFSKDVPSVVIFQGPQGYITPSWYASKKEHGKVVPTWNYAVVHAHGLPRVIDDAAWLLRHVTAMTTEQESRHPPGEWEVSDAPADFIQSMLRMIVGIEIPLTALVGKWKMSQNRSAADRLGAIAGLKERGDADSTEVAALVERYASKA